MLHALPFRTYNRLLTRSLAFWVLALAFNQVTCSPALGQTLGDSLSTASSQIRAGEYDAAIGTVRAALPAHRSDPRLYTLEGIAYSLKGDDAHALECLRQATSIDPRFQRALQAEASILSRHRDDSVIPVLQKILEQDPGDSTAHEMLALAQAQRGDCPAALREFAKAGPALATHADSLQRKAACLLQTRAYVEAVRSFEQVRSLHPNDKVTVYDLAIAQYETGDAKAVVNTLEPLLAAAPDIDTLLLAADAYEELGDTPRSAALLRQAIVADPNRSDSYIRFAELCMAHESYQPGVEMVSAGISRQPHDATLYLSRGLLYGGMAQYDKAEADFRSAEQLDPKHGKGAYAVGLIEAQRNDPERALTTVRSGLKAHPDDAQLHFLLARLLIEQGAPHDSPAYAEATHSAQDAVRLDPNLLAARDLLAKIYLETGKPALAAEQCRAVLALDSSDGNALYRLMRSLRAMGDDQGARAVSQQVAAQHQHAREEETGRLRYRIETSTLSDQKRPEAPNGGEVPQGSGTASQPQP